MRGVHAERKVPVVGSYAVLKSIANAPRARQGGSPGEPPAAAPPKPATGPPRPPGTPLTHTVMPTRHALACYHCDEEFHVLGQHRFTLCPHCRQRVDIVDYALDGDFEQDIKTAGTVHLKPGARVCGGRIKTTTMRVEGRVESGRVEALRLELEESGELAPAAETRFRDLVVSAGVEAVFEAPLRCRDLTVRGLLRAAVRVDGRALIEPGGCLEGSLSTARLKVEEGGGLRADLDVRPDPGDADR